MSISDRVSGVTQGLARKLEDFLSTDDPQKIIELLKVLYNQYNSSDYTNISDFLRGRNISKIGGVRVQCAEFESSEYIVLDFGNAPQNVSSKYDIVSRFLKSGKKEDGHFLLEGHEPYQFYIDDAKKYIGIKAEKQKSSR